MVTSCLVLALWTVVSNPGPDAARVSQQAGRWVLANDCLQRTIDTSPRLHTVAITNRRTRPERRHAVESQEFTLALDGESLRLTAADFAVENVRGQRGASGAELDVRLACAKHGVGVTVHYQIGDRQPYLRKRLEIEPGEHLVNWVDVETLRLPGVELARFDQDPMPFRGHPWDIAVGRPLFAGREMFLGVEHPASVNAFDAQGWITLRQHPGRKGRLETAPAVIGMAADEPRQRLLDVFEEYVRANRARPVKRSIQWVAYFAVDMDDEACRQKIAVAEQVFRRRQVPLDMVLMDSGWTDPQSIMRISPQRPDRLALMTQLARERLGCGLGLHVITSGVKSMVDKDWLAAQGYDMIFHKSKSQGAYCFADPRVLDEFQRNLVGFVRQYGIAAYKFDWGHFACPAANHRGHLPGEVYGFEAGASNFARAQQAFRQANPDIFLFNTGWYSPWWLWTYDAVFASGADYNFGLAGPPAATTAALLCTWRDATIRGNIVRWSPFFPIDSLMTVDPISYWWHEWDVRSESPLRPFTDYFLLAALRGTQMTEIYNNIAAWSPAHAEAAADVLRWMKAHDDVILASTRYFGGDPLQAMPYGYAHFDRRNHGVIALRNPSVEPRGITVPFDEQTGMWPAGREYIVRVVYPYTQVLPERARYGDIVHQELGADEVRVLEVWPLDALPEPMPVGCRYRVASREPGSTTFRLAANDREIGWLSPVKLAGATAAGPAQYTLRLPAPVTPPSAAPAVRAALAGPASRLTATIDVPPAAQARVSLVFAGRGVTGTMMLDGKPVAPDMPHVRLADVGNRTTGLRAQAADWSLFGLDVGPSHHELTFVPVAGGKSKQIPPVRLVVDATADAPGEQVLRIEHAPLDRPTHADLPQNWAWQMRSATVALVPRTQ
jgi:hypothetical protein